MKENELYWVGDDEFRIQSGESGLYRRDTRFLSEYRWELDGAPLNTLMQHLAYPFELHQVSSNDDLGYLMKLGVERTLMLHKNGVQDTLNVQSYQDASYQIRLKVNADFSDMFQVRGYGGWERSVQAEATQTGVRFRYAGQDGVTRHTEISCDPAAVWDGEALNWQARGNTEIQIQIHALLDGESAQEMDFAALRSEYDQHWQPKVTLQNEKDQEVLFRGVQDFRSLLFETRSGIFPAAGIPWFVAPFGRDSLIIGHMTVRDYPEISKGILKYLADHQGQKLDAETLEEPGKILHEERIGEFTRTGNTPHRPYYGTVDATPLFVWLCGEYLKTTGDQAFIADLLPGIEAALHWMQHDADPDGDGFLEYIPHPVGGIKNQVWKDSGDSVFFEDGEEPDPEKPIAIVEVQGYAYAAYRAAEQIYAALGNTAQAQVYRALAHDLQQKFQQHFYWPEANYYVHGLDGDKKPMKVLVSNAAHTLWTGIIPEQYAIEVARTVFNSGLWSGWGIRTLAEGSVRYNPVSYHNGSVWPHDTALAALGMWNYGLKQEAHQITRALFDAALQAQDRRLSELFAGYTRKNAPPVPFPAACHPQGWDAVIPLALRHILEHSGRTLEEITRV
ncbi:glycogen debranching N-terminal domain-containing protein [Deinococcus roseus]|uniref:glycogen debranching N-terminal domain-containing protein n=1 Tax=Deinococcus roseus TaxID=392414 RepID=UPI001E5B513D|nr:glycogen debranching N-terminal domain-containing protein [Deinococcus roseus]